MKELENFFVVDVPTLPDDLVNFNFETDIEDKKFIFYFKFFNDRWNCWVNIDGDVRHIGVFPNILNMKGFRDFAIFFEYDGDSIEYEALSGITIWVLKWTQ
jgi:hypothetical protein